jgi:hypothetical protein
MAGPTGFPLNAISFIPGGPAVINVTALGSNNAISFQLNGVEIANINQSGALSTAGGGGIATFGAFGSAPSANGATVSGTVATLQPADATHPGGITIGAQTIAGAKTFTGTTTFGPAGSTLAISNDGDGDALITIVGAPGSLAIRTLIGAGGAVVTLELKGDASSIILYSPNGTKYGVSVSNAGALVVAAL